MGSWRFKKPGLCGRVSGAELVAASRPMAARTCARSEKSSRTREIAVAPNLMFRLAISQATISVDGLGNPRIEKLSENNRIDLVQAGAIAAGLVKRYRLQRKPGPSFVVAEPAA